MNPEVSPQVFLDRRGRLVCRGRLPAATFDAQVAEGERVAVTLGRVTRHFTQASGMSRECPMAFATDVAVIHQGQRDIVLRAVNLSLDRGRFHLASLLPKGRVVGWNDDLMDDAPGAAITATEHGRVHHPS